MAAMSDEQPPPRTGTGGHSGGAPTVRRAQRRRRGPLVRRVLLVTGLLLLVFGALTAWQAWNAYGHLMSAAEQAPALREQLLSDDDLEGAASDLEEHARAAREALDGTNWQLLGAVPGVGDDVQAVRSLTVALDELASGALREVVSARDLVRSDDLRVRGGRINLALLESVEPHLTKAQASTARAAATVAGVEQTGLVDALRVRFADAEDQVSALGELTERAATTVRLLPPMLGRDGPRDYLVLVLNNAEPRALVGLPGSLVTMRVGDGRIRLTGQRSAISFPEPVLPLSEPEVALFGSQLGRYIGNVTSTPHYPRAAQLAHTMWERQTGDRVDGILAVDPVLLGMLLELTGPVALPDIPLVRQVDLPEGQQLTPENAAQVLLNQVYLDIEDPELQNAFYAVATEAIFDRLMKSELDLLSAVRVLGDEDAQGRAYLWSARKAEQRELSDLELGGALEGERDGQPVVGVYLHDRSQAKIAYYQRMTVDARLLRCTPSGSRLVEVNVELRADTPPGVRALPAYVSGAGDDIPAGFTRSDLLVYAPEGGLITQTQRGDGGPLPVTAYFHRGLHVAARTFVMKPNGKINARYRIELDRRVDTLEVRSTPGPERGRFAVRLSPCA